MYWNSQPSHHLIPVSDTLETLLAQVRTCQLCQDLPLGPNPIVQAGKGARILVAGQAPGRITHGKGRPFDDASGERLRTWMGIDRATFYDPDKLAILAMGFCYPGTKKGGDLPPRILCANTWRARLLGQLPNVRLLLVIGQYAHAWHFTDAADMSLTERVRAWKNFGNRIPLPHPSPRNGGWIKNNPWFAEQLLPDLRTRVEQALS